MRGWRKRFLCALTHSLVDLAEKEDPESHGLQALYREAVKHLYTFLGPGHVSFNDPEVAGSPVPSRYWDSSRSQICSTRPEDVA